MENGLHYYFISHVFLDVNYPIKIITIAIVWTDFILILLEPERKILLNISWTTAVVFDMGITFEYTLQNYNIVKFTLTENNYLIEDS